jgi:hypothetical protein
MRIDNSNSSSALIQDLGPFKLKNANQSFKGKIIKHYKTISSSINLGTKSIYGGTKKFGSNISTLPQNSFDSSSSGLDV